jgi:hypothetical protein
LEQNGYSKGDEQREKLNRKGKDDGWKGENKTLSRD